VPNGTSVANLWGEECECFGTHNFTVPTKLMGSVFISEGASFAGVNWEDSSGNHPRAMSSFRQATLRPGGQFWLKPWSTQNLDTALFLRSNSEAVR
jgi:hypothetical protein